MVQSLIQRIRENKLDALYLFINESLRDRNEFDVFFHNLMVVLPNNWSINRVEIGHEFLSRTVVADQQQAAGNNNNNGSQNESKQDQLFRWVCSLESLRSLIISDGYIPRKDHGFLDTKALLRNLPRANNLQYLDIQRLKLRITGDDFENNDAELLAESLDSLRDSLEDLRLPAISLWGTTTRTTAREASNNTGEGASNIETQSQRYPLDPLIRVCGEMTNLQLLAISCANCSERHNDSGDEQQQPVDGGRNRADGGNEGDNNNNNNNNNNPQPTYSLLSLKNCLISREVLLQLCRSSSTLQELALRSMGIDDDTCKTIATAFDPPGNLKPSSSSLSLSLMCGDSDQDNDDDFAHDALHISDADNQHSPSFWTSLDLRQNPSIGTAGYEAILSSLERNYDLWCSLMVDDASFQSRFNALIELNQANRGALVRSPTPEKLSVFLDRLKDDPTALWYFLTIHRNSILHPLIRFLKWKNAVQAKCNSNNPQLGSHDQWRERQMQLLQGNQPIGQKRTAEVAALHIPVVLQQTLQNGGIPSTSSFTEMNANEPSCTKRAKHATEDNMLSK